MRQAWTMYANEMNNSELTRSAVARVFLSQLATLWTLFPSFCLSQTQDFLCRFVFGASSAIRSTLKDSTSFGQASLASSHIPLDGLGMKARHMCPMQYVRLTTSIRRKTTKEDVGD